MISIDKNSKVLNDDDMEEIERIKKVVGWGIISTKKK